MKIIAHSLKLILLSLKDRANFLFAALVKIVLEDKI